jgi:hypothetical protein
LTIEPMAIGYRLSAGGENARLASRRRPRRRRCPPPPTRSIKMLDPLERLGRHELPFASCEAQAKGLAATAPQTCCPCPVRSGPTRRRPLPTARKRKSRRLKPSASSLGPLFSPSCTRTAPRKIRAFCSCYMGPLFRPQNCKTLRDCNRADSGKPDASAFRLMNQPRPR